MSREVEIQHKNKYMCSLSGTAWVLGTLQYMYILVTVQLPSTFESQSASPGEYHQLGLWVRIPVPFEDVWLKVPTLHNSSNLHTQTPHTHTLRQSAKPVQNKWVSFRGHHLATF